MRICFYLLIKRAAVCECCVRECFNLIEMNCNGWCVCVYRFMCTAYMYFFFPMCVCTREYDTGFYVNEYRPKNRNRVKKTSGNKWNIKYDSISGWKFDWAHLGWLKNKNERLHI